jgi:hypothetical protein
MSKSRDQSLEPYPQDAIERRFDPSYDMETDDTYKPEYLKGFVSIAGVVTLFSWYYTVADITGTEGDLSLYAAITFIYFAIFLLACIWQSWLTLFIIPYIALCVYFYYARDEPNATILLLVILAAIIVTRFSYYVSSSPPMISSK